MTTNPPRTVEILFTPAPGVRRAMTVQVPDENQLAVWAASGERYQAMGEEWAAEEAALASADPTGPEWAEYRSRKATQATKALARGVRLIRSALVGERDGDWVEEKLLDGAFNLGDALGILTQAIAEMKSQRADQAPAAGPAKKARRS